MAQNGLWTRSSAPDSYSEPAEFSREVAYGIQTLVNAEAAGFSNSERLGELVEFAFGHLDQWFHSQTAPYIQSFMVGLTAHALIDYYDASGSVDARVVPELTHALDSLWDLSWNAEKQQFDYAYGDFPNSQNAEFSDTDDLNLLIAPAYEWVYHQTGEERFRTRGEAIFTSGVNGAWLNGTKQFNQNYRWSFDYVELYTNASPTQKPELKDPAAYLASYPDLIQTFGYNPNAAAQHYIDYGWGEGRTTSFSPASYVASSDNLIATFGVNLEAATEHYIKQGFYEGHQITFQADDYLASYGDLIEAFGYNLEAAALHYVQYGAAEGRVHDKFNEISYLGNYADLQAAFDSNDVLATRHYIQYGYAEGRTV